MIRLRRVLALFALVALGLSPGIAPFAAHAQTITPTTITTTTDANAGDVLLKSGVFVNAGETGNGTATLYRLADGTHLLRLEAFRVDFGPDLRVQLVTSDGTVRDIAGLRAFRGNQNYLLPADFDPALFESARIHCRVFNIVMIVAPLA